MQTIQKSVFIKSLTLLGVSFLTCFSLLRSYLFDIHKIQFDGSGDGLKNYFTFAYQYKYGSGIHFKGMLYPYGDLATYADAQPLLVWIFQLLRGVGIDLTDHSLLIINGSMILGLTLGIFFVYKIFREFNLPAWFSILFAGLAVAMSPQLNRFISHFGLAYIFIIPAYWFLLLQISSKRKWQVSHLVLVVFTFACGFLHPYMLLMTTIFGLAFFAVQTLMQRRFDIKMLVSILLPLVLFFITMHFLDGISDRPENPYGLEVYKTERVDLLPHYGWLSDNFQETFDLRKNATEGYGYLGLLVFLVPIFSLILFFYKKVKPQIAFKNNFEISKKLNVSFFASLLVLAFAMGLHLKFGGDFILKMIPPLSQFRSLGRMVWVFYYVGFVFLAVHLFRILSTISNKKIRTVLWAVIVILSLLEINSYHQSIYQNIKKYHGNNTLFQKTDLLDILKAKKINTKNYQAIFTLPATTEGTEKLYLNGDWHVKTRTLPLSYQTGLPLTSCIMSRSSIDAALGIVQLSSSAFVKKRVIDLLNEKDLLLVIPIKMIPIYQDLMAKAERIGETKELAMFTLPVSSLKNQKYVKVSEVDSAFSINKLKENSLHNDHTHGVLFYDGFEANEAQGLKSKAALLSAGENILIDQNISISEKTKLRISFWYKIQATKSNVPSFKVETFDQNQNPRLKDEFRDLAFDRLEVIENWVRLYKEYDLDIADKRLKFTAYGEHLMLDHLLVTSGDEKVYRDLDQGYLIYDHYIAQKN